MSDRDMSVQPTIFLSERSTIWMWSTEWGKSFCSLPPVSLCSPPYTVYPFLFSQTLEDIEVAGRPTRTPAQRSDTRTLANSALLARVTLETNSLIINWVMMTVASVSRLWDSETSTPVSQNQINPSNPWTISFLNTVNWEPLSKVPF